MELVPLVPRAKVLPNLDALPLIRDLFQEEFQEEVPSKKLSRNLLTSLRYEKQKTPEEQTYRSFEYLENLTRNKERLIEFAEDVSQAYESHDEQLHEIWSAEKDLFEAHVGYLKREMVILESKAIQDFLSLKRQPLLRALNPEYVRKYRLIQGEAGLPPHHEAKSDFRVKNFKRIRKLGIEDRWLDSFNRVSKPCDEGVRVQKEPTLMKPHRGRLRPRKSTAIEQEVEIFRAEPRIVFFTGYKPGDVYAAEILLKNVCTKGMKFQVKPMASNGPFHVTVKHKSATRVLPGLSFRLTVEFTPTSVDVMAEDVCISIENGHELLIPLIAYVEAPVLKTHIDLDKFARTTAGRIASSYIECGSCFSGDIKVIKLRFSCHRAFGEFFIMTSDNWNWSHVNSVTADNLLELPPFRVYPVFFKMEKDEVIDLFVEFSPKSSGTHVENVVITCNNGEVRSLDLLGDAVGWHSYYFTFQESLLKELSMDNDDDIKVKYLLDFEDAMPTGKVEKVFCVTNNSDMAFEFQWKIREANIFNGQEKYFKLFRSQVTIEPDRGTFEPKSVWEFLVTINFSGAEIGKYRMVLSLYVLNLPYQCIEEDTTIIQPTGLVRNLYSQSLYDEEDVMTPSYELLSLKGTYESLQESIKSYIECQTKAQAPPKSDFCKTTCANNPGLCAKPLKKSKTFVNIGDNLEDEALQCVCRLRPPEGESYSGSCISNAKANELPVQMSEVIWDFVDVLVNEIELWVEVSPTRVTLKQSVMELSLPLKVDGSPVYKKIEIVNHNRFPIKCKWLKSTDTASLKTEAGETEPKDKSSFSLLFNKKAKSKGKLKEKNESSKEESKMTPDQCWVTVEPEDTFTVPGFSEFACRVGLTALRPGKIKQMLTLSVNDGDLELNAVILGEATAKYFMAAPQILDFGFLRQGTRCDKEYKILNGSNFPLFWTVNQYVFDFVQEKFFKNPKFGDALTKKTGTLMTGGSIAKETYFLETRTPGIKCVLLEFQVHKPELGSFFNQYIIVLGKVKLPLLSLSTPRFHNEILAPPGTMYVGKKVHTKVTLHNHRSVSTDFLWGHPFGCHCRKINVHISPKSCSIENNKSLEIDITLTPLAEGIINHCYVHCFFSRNMQPLTLSIIGLVEDVSVTFEIIDYPMQNHADPESFLKTPNYHTVLRIPWPVKSYDPNLRQKFLRENCFANKRCQCLEVDEEADRAFSAAKWPLVEEIDGESDISLYRSLETKDDMKIPSANKYTKRSLEENLNQCSLSDYSSLGKRTIFCPVLETPQYVKTQLEFLNVPCQTQMSRRFVIRNETPIATTFQISVLHFGEKAAEEKTGKNRIQDIKNKVLGYPKDELGLRLPKESPLVLAVEPSRGELPGLDTVCVTVRALGNTWGEYRDVVICEIKGLKPFHLKVFIQIVGHPIYFPMFANQAGLSKPVLRFQPLANVSSPFGKKIRVANRSAIPLTVSWIVFLTEPPPEHESLEDGSNGTDSHANLDSNHSKEESTKSSKVYLPKNAFEGSNTLANMMDKKESSQHSTSPESFIKTEFSTPGKKENRESVGSAKSFGVPLIPEETKCDSQIFSLLGRIDNQIFQVDPKEISLEPFQEKKISITFHPDYNSVKAGFRDFKAILTGCVKLAPDFENSDNYYRPCGINFVSELLDLDASQETPLVSFEILKGDLTFLVDANAVLKSPNKRLTVSRKFLIKNQTQSLVRLKIEIVPGANFRVVKVDTLDKVYWKYNPEKHLIEVHPGQVLEMELECAVAYRDVIYGFEVLKQIRRKQRCSVLSEDVRLSDVKTSDRTKSEKDKEKEEKKMSDREPWNHYFCNMDARARSKARLVNGSWAPKDSLVINLNRMTCRSVSDYCPEEGKEYLEAPGEYLDLSLEEESLLEVVPELHMTTSKAEISFVQEGIVTQSLTVQLHLSFPGLKISPDFLDFGNVYIQETAVRYCSVFNLTGFPTDLKIKSRCPKADFSVKVLEESIPAMSYNSDLGGTIAVEFRPIHPGYSKGAFHIYCNPNMEFDFYELFVCGIGTWNERYKAPRVEFSAQQHKKPPSSEN